MFGKNKDEWLDYLKSAEDARKVFRKLLGTAAIKKSIQTTQSEKTAIFIDGKEQWPEVWSKARFIDGKNEWPEFWDEQPAPEQTPVVEVPEKSPPTKSLSNLPPNPYGFIAEIIEGPDSPVS